MTPELQGILKQCDRLSAHEQLALIQALAEKLKNPVASAAQPQGATPNSNRAATTPAPYQPKNAKDYINHIR